ncbi:SDR family oxidoreductase [uncultured Mucilaginibacter sp.]|uniref:SDR family oxidoreductase n=1 Tax=uncultured Mucilaginibacter sp. TaxID=797541 RepID=UPI002637EAFD|nr:SDR family oxidoreductase [uncultured Mucilaginibacter sp.]
MNGGGKGKKIGILGCGWLGFPLAKNLVEKGWQVHGSTTTPQKLQLLQEAGIKPFLLALDANSDLSNSTFFDADVLFINVPPSRKLAQSGYLDKMKTLLAAIQTSSIKKVIFVSSTSVYGDVCREVTEADEPDNPSELLQAEMLFLSAKNLQTTVIRFGGLFGPDRNPGRFFRDKNSIPNGLVPVNLIHLNDCLSLIEAVLDQQKFFGVYNAVAPSHPTKQEFYGKAILRSGFGAPEFVAEKTVWKIINAEKIVQDLNYRFQYPDLLSCLDDSAAF